MYKILIADDEEDILDVMAKKIEAEGYQVLKAYDGAKAWELFQAESPDVVVLDLNMPNLNGFEVLERIRSNASSKKWQPVIIVSARRELDDLHKGFNLEADHYMTKPCGVSDILKSIKLMISLIPQRDSSEK